MVLNYKMRKIKASLNKSQLLLDKRYLIEHELKIPGKKWDTKTDLHK